MRGVFDIIGPIMVGPSSSHTAGAVRIGRMVKSILGEDLQKAIIFFHGSFARTYKGHGTNLAIVAGLLGFDTDDERIKDSLNIAREQSIDISFETTNIDAAHPNTAKIIATGQSGKTLTVQGASVGGGNIVINNINGYEVYLTGTYNALITIHHDSPGVLAKITYILAQEDNNIAFMRLSRNQRGDQALMFMENDQPISEEALERIRKIPEIEVAFTVPKL